MMILRAFATALLLGLAAALLWGERVEAAFPGQNGRIAFASDAGNNFDIYSIKRGGTDLRRLTTDPDFDTNPVYSPDGRRIAFKCERDTDHHTGEICVMDADGADEHVAIRSTHSIGQPTWAPDGQALAFARQDGNYHASDFNVYVKLLGSDALAQRLTDSPADDFAPAWAPRGGRIAFVSERNGGDGDVFTMSATGANERDRTNNDDDYDSDPAWAADGDRIAFESDRAGDFDIFAMRPDGSRVHQRTDSPGNDAGPAWSPNGARIAAHDLVDSDPEIFTIRAKGTDRDRQRLTQNGVRDIQPDWQPR